MAVETSEHTTLVLGASPHDWRYSHAAVLRLTQHGHPVIAIGNRQGTIGETEILIGAKPVENSSRYNLYP